MVKSDGIPVANVSVNEHKEKISNHNQDPQTTNSFLQKTTILFIDITTRRKAVYHFLFSSWCKKRAPVQRHICISKRCSFFLSSGARKIFMHTQGHQQVGEILGSNNIIQTTTIAVNGVEHQKLVKSKNGKWTNWFSQAIKEIFHHNIRESLNGGRKKKVSNLAMQF